MGRARYIAVASFLPLAFLLSFYGFLLLDQPNDGPDAEVAVLLQGVSDVNTRTLALYQKEVTFFQPCPYQRQPHSFEDWTGLFEDVMGLQDSCLSNPSVAVVSKGYLLVSMRIYTSRHNARCVTADAEGGQWKEGWDGYGGFGLALVKRSAAGEAKILAHMHRIDDSTEDARLFIDGQGKMRMLYNRHRGGDPTMRGFKRFQRRSMHTVEVIVNVRQKSLRLQNEQELIYIFQERDEKNWVAWEGTTLMSYPQYPLFAPHTVLDWKSYDLAEDQMEVTALSPVPWIDAFRRATGGWIRFSGGTPGIRLDQDTFLAVGHAVGDLSCFHASRDTAVGNVMSAVRRMLADPKSESHLLGHKCNSQNPAPKGHYDWKEHFESQNHSLPHHHPYWEYFFFFYTWSAYFPYEIVGISYAFIPDDAPEHMGVYFPSGLQRMPDKSIMVSYGKDDARMMVMTVSESLVYEWVKPIDRLDPENYKFCSIGSGRPLLVMGPGRNNRTVTHRT